jgi:hypothetical protein
MYYQSTIFLIKGIILILTEITLYRWTEFECLLEAFCTITFPKNYTALEIRTTYYKTILSRRKLTVTHNIWRSQSGSYECLATCYTWFFTLKMEAIRSSEKSVHTWSIRRYIPEDGISNTFHFHTYFSGKEPISIQCLNSQDSRW